VVKNIKQTRTHNKLLSDTHRETERQTDRQTDSKIFCSRDKTVHSQAIYNTAQRLERTDHIRETVTDVLLSTLILMTGG